MKSSPKLVLALLAAVSCAAGAETYSSQADQARRERNREEALANYRAGHTTARQEAHEVAQSARHGGHKVAVQARETTARTEAKFAPVEKKDPHGEAANPTGMSSTAANGPKP
jgi:Tfp pilus assembly protein PilP